MTFHLTRPSAESHPDWIGDVLSAEIEEVWTAFGLRRGLDPHRGEVRRKFRPLGRAAILIPDDGGPLYLGPLDLLCYVILGIPKAKGLSSDGWSRLHAAAYAAGLTGHAPASERLDLRAWTSRYTAGHTWATERSTRTPNNPDHIESSELLWFWEQRSSAVARPTLRALLDRWATARRLSTAAIVRLAERGEVALFAPDAIQGRRVPSWLPCTLRGRGGLLTTSLVVPVYDLRGQRSNLCARPLQQTGGRLKAARATGIRCSGQLYANASGRGVLADRSPSEGAEVLVIAEGETDWLLWATERPDLPSVGIFSGSVQPDLGHRLAEAIDRGWKIALRTDRDSAGDAYAERICEVIRRAGGDLGAVFRAQPHPDQAAADDGDLHAEGLLCLDDPLADTRRVALVDAQAREPWASLPTTPLRVLREERVGRSLREGLSSGVPTILSFSTGVGKTHSLLSMLSSRDSPGGVTVVAVQSRHAVVEITDALRGAGVEAVRFLGRDGPQASQDRIDEFSLGTQAEGMVISCVNASVLYRVRRGLDARVACGKCPFRSVCERPADPRRTGTRGDVLNVRAVTEAGLGVVVCTHQGLPAALGMVGGSLAEVIIDELPTGYGGRLRRSDIEELVSHQMELGRMAQQPDLFGLSDVMLKLADATELLVALLNAEFTAADVRRGDRSRQGLSGADIRTPIQDADLQLAAREWMEVFENEQLQRHPAACFPNLRRSALRVLSALSRDGTSADVVAGEDSSPYLSLIEPLHIPPGVPVVGLDATPLPDRWEAILGKPVQIRGARVPRHINERAIALHSSYHRSATWNVRERRLARAEMQRLLALSGGELEDIRQARCDEPEGPLVLLVGWKSHLKDIDEVIGDELRRGGFRVRATHWYSSDFRGSNTYKGTAAVMMFGLPRVNGDAQRLEARALARVRGEPLQSAGAEVDWTSVTRSALAAMTQAAGRARASVDPDEKPTLFVSLSPIHPHVVRELIDQGRGVDLGKVRGNDRTTMAINTLGLGWVGGLLTNAEATPGIPEDQRPSRSGLERYLRRLREEGAESVTVPFPDRRGGRAPVFYRVPHIDQPLEEALEQMGASGILEAYQQMTSKPPMKDQAPEESTRTPVPRGGLREDEAWAHLPRAGDMLTLGGDPVVLVQLRRVRGVPSAEWPATVRRFTPSGWVPEDVRFDEVGRPHAEVWAQHVGLRVRFDGVEGFIERIDGDGKVYVRMASSGRVVGVLPHLIRPEGAGPVSSSGLNESDEEELLDPFGDVGVADDISIDEEWWDEY